MELNGKSIKRVYSGRPGCMCGCRGNYWDTPKQITRIGNIIHRSSMLGMKVNVTDTYAAFEDNGRVYVAYFVD